jgi:hypothetical protein
MTEHRQNEFRMTERGNVQHRNAQMVKILKVEKPNVEKIPEIDRLGRRNYGTSIIPYIYIYIYRKYHSNSKNVHYIVENAFAINPAGKMGTPENKYLKDILLK